MNVVILVPVKDRGNAKSRLSALLTQGERGAVALAMFNDLVRALRPLAYPISLVTNSHRSAAQGKELGWRVFWEQEQISESISIDTASRELAAEGVDAVLRLPADLPWIRVVDIEELLSQRMETPYAVLAPSRDKKGTNALLRNPPCLFPSHFGPDSFTLHLREATERGIAFKVVENPRLAFDLDDVADLVEFLAHPSDCETYRTLMKLNIQKRLAQHGHKGYPNLGHPGNP